MILTTEIIALQEMFLKQEIILVVMGHVPTQLLLAMIVIRMMLVITMETT